MLAGKDQSQANQPSNLAEGTPGNKWIYGPINPILSQCKHAMMDGPERVHYEEVRTKSLRSHIKSS